MGHEEYWHSKHIAECVGDGMNDALSDFQNAVIEIIDEEIKVLDNLLEGEEDTYLLIKAVAQQRALKRIKTKIKNIYK